MSLSPPYRMAYDVPPSDSAFALCKSLGFNIVHNFGWCDWSTATKDYWFTLAEKYDLYVCMWCLFNPALREEIITAYKDEPQLWAWYLYDEPGCRGVVPKAQQIACYNEIKGYDPNTLIATSFGEGETRAAYEPAAFDIMLAYGIYPCSQADPLHYLYARLVTLGRVQYITDALSKGKIWLPIIHTWQKISEWCWCDRCETIDSSAHPAYNGMEGVRAMYEMYKNEVGTAPHGASYYRYPDIAGSHSCNAVMRRQIRNLNYGILGAPFMLSGSLTFDKTFSWKRIITEIAVYLSGKLNFTSLLSKYITYPILSGSFSFSGNLFSKFILPLLSGTLGFTGSLNTKLVILKRKTIQGALNFSSALSHNFKLLLTANVSFIGAIKLKIKSFFSGALTLIGFFKAESVALSICTKTYTFLETLTWAEFEGYTWCRVNYKTISLSGFLSPSGLLPKKVLLSLAGVLSFLGSPFVKAKIVLSGALSSSGTFTKVFIKALLSGDISFSSLIGKFIKKPLSGALSFLGWNQTTTGNLKYLIRKLIQLMQVKGE